MCLKVYKPTSRVLPYSHDVIHTHLNEIRAVDFQVSKLHYFPRFQIQKNASLKKKKKIQLITKSIFFLPYFIKSNNIYITDK